MSIDNKSDNALNSDLGNSKGKKILRYSIFLFRGFGLLMVIYGCAYRYYDAIINQNVR